MKTIIWVVTLAIGVSLAEAQTKKPLEYHVYGGANALYITDQAPIYEVHYGLGWLVGGGVRYGKRAFVQTGLEVAGQQVTMAARSAESTIVSNAKLTLRTVQVPVMAGFKLVKAKNDFWDLNLAVGAKIGVISPQENPFNLKASNFEKPILTPTFSMGLDVWKITAGLNYQYGGLTPIFKNYASGVELHTATMVLGVRF